MARVDQNRAKLGGKVSPQFIPEIIPEFPEHDWEATDLVSTSRLRAEQCAIKEGVNDPSMEALLARKPEVANPSAAAEEFQPYRSDTEKEEVRWQHGSESDSQYAGIDVQPGKELGALAKDPEFNAKTCLVGDMVTGPDPKAEDIGRKQIEAVVGGELMAGGSLEPPRRPYVPLKDWPVDTSKTFVQNAPNPGKE